jgi:RNA polymerase sigma factor (sigma-70 family)
MEENMRSGSDYQLLYNDNPESRLSKLQVENNINRALRCVTPMEKAVIVLRFFSELKIHEVAKHLSVSQSTVKTLLYRALDKLQEELVLKDRPYRREDSR